MPAPRFHPVTQLARLGDFVRFVAARFFEDRCPQAAASLAYTTLLALVPLVTVAITMLAAFPVFGDIMTQLKIFLLTNMVPETAGRIITVYMVQFSEKAARLTMIGIAFLIVTALLLIQTIDRTFNTIWRVRQQRGFVHRFLTYWAVLTVGPLLLGASLSVTYYLLTLSLGYVKHLPLVGTISLQLVPPLLMVLTFSLLYFAVPNRYVPFRHALVGGVVAGIGFELMKRGFAWYITSFPTYKLVYGAFAAFPIFLVWIYVSWLVILVGAVIAAALSHWRGGAWLQRRYPGWSFVAALRVLGELVAAQHSGHTVTLAALRRRVQLGLEDLEEILDQLRAANIVRRAEHGSWLLSRSPDEIRAADVYRLFVFDMSESPLVREHDRLERLVAEIARGEEAVLSVSLAELFAPPAGAAETVAEPVS
jgi:membrane protein